MFQGVTALEVGVVLLRAALCVCVCPQVIFSCFRHDIADLWREMLYVVAYDMFEEMRQMYKAGHIDEFK